MKIGAFGSFFAPGTHPQSIGRLAKDMDEAGLDSLWFGEHALLFDEMEFPYPGSADGRLPIPHGQGAPDQTAIIGYLAGMTKNLRFGTGISLITQRNPIYTAKEFATLDWLTQGRVDLGVGVGWCKEEVLASGYSWHDRGARCDEALDLMINLWTNDVTDHNGANFTVKGARMDPKPIQTPHIPLIIGGFSKAALRRTAKYGAGWLGFGLTPQMTAPMLAALDSALAKEGRTRTDIEIIMMPGDDSEEAADAFAELGVNRLTPMIEINNKTDTNERVAYLERLANKFS
ncbi:MAG: putative F420-dependent oxidoreductase [Limisphaerales bacterium]|jgi:probable F420-dependent oxidoreductase